jgi:adenylate kinase family enzyme
VTPPRLLVTGASGSGVTTLGEGLAAALALPHVEVDPVFWLPTDPPFTDKRPIPERLALLGARLSPPGWVLSGSCNGWGDPATGRATAAILVETPTPVRLARLAERERRRFGERIASDGDVAGDMAGQHRAFLAWAARYDDPTFDGRNHARHLGWLEASGLPFLRLDGTPPRDAVLAGALDWIAAR